MKSLTEYAEWLKDMGGYSPGFDGSHLIMEMATVGIFDKYRVVVYTNDPGRIPHFHIIDDKTNGNEFRACVKILTNEYFIHGSKKGTLNSKMRKELNNLLHSVDIEFGMSFYEVMIKEWNKNNSKTKITPKRDSKGDIIIPDYTVIN